MPDSGPKILRYLVSRPPIFHDRLEVAGDDPSAIASTAMVLAVFGEDLGTVTALANHVR